MPPTTDEGLVLQVKNGDSHSFAELFDRYAEKITRYVRRLGVRDVDIPDTIQDTFLKVFKNIQSFDDGAKFSSWLYRIAHNEAISHLRKKKSLPIPTFDIDTFFPQYFEDDGALQGEVIDRELERKRIDGVLESLDQKYREVTVLYYYEELTYEEIAEVLKVPKTLVGVRLKRAREKLASLLREATK